MSPLGQYFLNQSKI